MIKKVYFSTLCGETFDTKKKAQKAEDKYVEDYFKQLDDRAQAKRRRMRDIANIDDPIKVSIYHI